MMSSHDSFGSDSDGTIKSKKKNVPLRKTKKLSSLVDSNSEEVDKGNPLEIIKNIDIKKSESLVTVVDDIEKSLKGGPLKSKIDLSAEPKELK